MKKYLTFLVCTFVLLATAGCGKDDGKQNLITYGKTPYRIENVTLMHAHSGSYVTIDSYSKNSVKVQIIISVGTTDNWEGTYSIADSATAFVQIKNTATDDLAEKTTITGGSLTIKELSEFNYAITLNSTTAGSVSLKALFSGETWYAIE